MGGCDAGYARADDDDSQRLERTPPSSRGERRDAGLHSATYHATTRHTSSVLHPRDFESASLHAQGGGWRSRSGRRVPYDAARAQAAKHHRHLDRHVERLQPGPRHRAAKGVVRQADCGYRAERRRVAGGLRRRLRPALQVHDHHGRPSGRWRRVVQGTADLGPKDGGVYDWIGRADDKEFVGFFTSGFYTGVFTMTKAN